MADELTTHGVSLGMNYGEVRALLKEHFDALLAAKKSRMDIEGRLTDDERAALQQQVAYSDDVVKGDLSLAPEHDAEAIEKICVQHGVEVPVNAQAYGRFLTEYKRAHRDASEALLAYDQSFETYDFSDRSNGHAVPGQVVPPTKGLPLQELTKRYTADKLRANEWAEKTKSERREHIALLFEILGADTDVRTLTISAAMQVKDTLHRYPKNRNKNPKTRGLTLQEVLAVPDTVTLNVKTLNKYLQTYSDLFRWAKRNGHVDTNAFEGVTIEHKRQRSRATRDAFSVEQIATMLGELTNSDSKLVRKPYRKWGPLIALYTGARLNEIAQAHLGDIREIDGVWCFDFNDEGDGKHLKTAASQRQVPVHSRLIELGLLDYVEQLRLSGTHKLFPSFTYDTKNGWGRVLGRWFNERFLPKLDLKTSGLVFHSLRHTVVTHLSQAGVEEPVVKAIVGHAREGVTQQHYFKQGYKISQIVEALRKLPY